MKAEIITIGDELLIGQTVDTNSAWMGQKLNSIGISVYQITSVSDTKSHILNALKETSDRSDLVLVTGGLGPTKDDITKQVLCEFFETKLVVNPYSLKDVENFILSRRSAMNELNKKQAEIPETCTPIQNLHGTAPGMWFEKENTVFVSMPGVPYEMKTMMENSIIPMLKEKFETKDIFHKTILVHGLPEAILAEKLDDWEDALPEYLKLAYLPSPGIIKLRFSAYGVDKVLVEKEVLRQYEKLKSIIPDNIAGFDKQKLEEEIGGLLINNKLTLCTAESCTGGRIAHLITTIPGASEYFQGSVVAYHNNIKIDQLKVKNQSIINYGAVSKAVVEEMAKGVKDKFQTDFSVSTSGIAGPTGGTDEKPVGTTWIAIAGPDEIVSKKFNFAGEREQIIDKAARTALNMFRLAIIKHIK